MVFLKSFIPVPVVGTLVNEIVGEYVGDLLYVMTMGGGVVIGAFGDSLKKIGIILLVVHSLVWWIES